MSKGLEALEILEQDLQDHSLLFMDDKIAIIEKELKALDIIRKYVKDQVANIDNRHEQKCLLVLVMEKEKDYNLLKEVLL